MSEAALTPPTERARPDDGRSAREESGDGQDRGAHDGGGATEPWTAAYLRARELEGRLLPDPLVAALPELPPWHPLAAEWRLRADSAHRLVAYLATRSPLRAIDVGCGNGWLAHRLAMIPGSSIVGLDANELELEQARRVFGPWPNLSFVLADALSARSPLVAPNVIVLGSMVQYVADLESLVGRLRDWLTPDGELHILDSPFYRPADLAAARARTRRYYERLGVPEMADRYAHHALRELAAFEPEVLYRPNAPVHRLERRLLRLPRSPFLWLRIRARQPADSPLRSSPARG